MLCAIFCQLMPTWVAKMPNLDKFDIAILKCLQEDARATNVEIAEKVNISP
ncbi:Lrp/AsnC family transcriptional regulator, partial [Rhizobium ruizarguesonis]